MRIVLFTGKGGVGKTTAASATALRLADRGVKTLLLSTDVAHSLADALDVPLGGQPREIEPSLWAVQIDTQDRFEAAWRDVQSFLVDVLSRGGVDPITADELTVLPGVEEVLALLAVREFALTGSWDVLVVDCAPTAETLRLLALPEALTWYLQKAFPVQRRIARGMRPIATMLGRGDAIPPDDMFDALLRLNDDLAGVRQLLADPAVTSVRLVLTPETVVAAEARRTFTALALYGYAVDLVVANRIIPAGDDAWRAGWARAQQRELVRIRDSFAGLPVRELPYCAAEPIGAVALRQIADALYGDGRTSDPLDLGPRQELLQIEADGADFVLRLALPLATRGAVDAARAGDDLVVTVAGHRRVLTLPSGLRRCAVVGGEFDGSQLRVRFRPVASAESSSAESSSAESDTPESDGWSEPALWPRTEGAADRGPAATQAQPTVGASPDAAPWPRPPTGAATSRPPADAATSRPPAVTSRSRPRPRPGPQPSSGEAGERGD